MKKRNRKLILISATVVGLLILGGAFVYANNHKSNDSVANTTAATQNSTDTTANSAGTADQSASGGYGGSASSTNSTNSTPPTKPTLAKSSGNNGSIPAGVNVLFTCSGAAGDSCEVILTNSANANNVVNLGKVTITSDRGATPAAASYWTTKSGMWTVVAKASNSSGQSSTSATQTITVQ